MSWVRFVGKLLAAVKALPPQALLSAVLIEQLALGLVVRKRPAKTSLLFCRLRSLHHYRCRPPWRGAVLPTA